MIVVRLSFSSVGVSNNRWSGSPSCRGNQSALGGKVSLDQIREAAKDGLNLAVLKDALALSSRTDVVRADLVDKARITQGDLNSSAESIAADLKQLAQHPEDTAGLSRQVSRMRQLEQKLDVLNAPEMLAASDTVQFAGVHQSSIQVVEAFAELGKAASQFAIEGDAAVVQKMAKSIEVMSETAHRILDKAGVFTDRPETTEEWMLRDSPNGELGRYETLSEGGQIAYVWVPWQDSPSDPLNEEKRQLFLNNNGFSGWDTGCTVSPPWEEVPGTSMGTCDGWVCTGSMRQSGFNAGQFHEAARARVAASSLNKSELSPERVAERAKLPLEVDIVYGPPSLENVAGLAAYESLRSLIVDLYHQNGGEGELPGELETMARTLRPSRSYYGRSDHHTDMEPLKRRNPIRPNAEKKRTEGSIVGWMKEQAHRIGIMKSEPTESIESEPMWYQEIKEATTDLKEKMGELNTRMAEKLGQLSEDERLRVLSRSGDPEFGATQTGIKYQAILQEMADYIQGDWAKDIKQEA